MVYKLTFMQVFNSFRLFLETYYEKTNLEDFNIIIGSMRSWESIFGGVDDCPTVDPAAWKDWMRGVEKTMKALKIAKDPKELVYDEQLAFLCLKNYLECFTNIFSWKDVLDLLDQVKKTEYSESDPLWQEWIKSINHIVYGTKELDVSFDPYTYERK